MIPPTIVADLCRRLDEAAAGTHSDTRIAARLLDGTPADDDPVAQLATAFRYYYSADDGEAFLPLVTAADGSTDPPRLRSVPEESVALWAACADGVTAPMVRARLHDLCFVRRHGHGQQHARAAVEAYLECVSLTDDQLEHTEWLRRALDLSRRTQLDAFGTQVLHQIVKVVQASLDPGDPDPGLGLPLLHVLVHDKAPPAQVDELLVQARESYPDVFDTDTIIRLQMDRARKDAQRRSELQRELVLVWAQAAQQAQPPVRVAHLERAARLARDFGLSELDEQIAAAMQTTRLEDLGLVEFHDYYELPAEQMEPYFAQFANSPNWKVALELLVQGEPPNGLLEHNRELADAAAARSPLMALLPTVIYGGDGLPRYRFATEEKAEFLLLQAEEIALAVRGPILVEALRRIWEAFSPIESDELADFLGSAPYVEQPVAMSLARAFLHFWRADYEACAYIAVPRVEALVRQLALGVRRGIYHAQRGKEPGQYPGMGALLEILGDTSLDPSWRRFLLTFFANPAGPNYRNELSHGFLDDVRARDAAVVLVAALFLAIGVEVTEKQHPRPEAVQDDAPAAPDHD